MTNFRRELLKKIAFAFLALLVPVVILGVLGWDIGRRALNDETQRQKLLNRSADLSIYAKLQSQSTQAESYVSVLQNVLPTRDQLFDFSNEMGRLAARVGVGFGFDFGNETPSTPSDVGRIAFTIVSSGPLNKIFQFIKSAETGRFFVNFKSFDISGPGTNINGEVLFY